MSEEIFRLDPYAKACHARVTKVSSDGVLLDKTVFYPQGGGQPGDTGFIKSTSGVIGRVTNTVKNRESGDHVHLIENAQKFLTSRKSCEDPSRTLMSSQEILIL